MQLYKTGGNFESLANFLYW